MPRGAPPGRGGGHAAVAGWARCRSRAPHSPRAQLRRCSTGCTPSAPEVCLWERHDTHGLGRESSRWAAVVFERPCRARRQTRAQMSTLRVDIAYPGSQGRTMQSQP